MDMWQLQDRCKYCAEFSWEKPYRMRPVGRPKYRWEDIKVCLNSSRIGGCRLHSFDLRRGSIVGFCEQGNEACVMLPGRLLPYYGMCTFVLYCVKFVQLSVVLTASIFNLCLRSHIVLSHVIFDCLSYIHGQQSIKYSGTSIYRFSRDQRKQTMNAGKRSIRETITHYTLRGAFKF